MSLHFDPEVIREREMEYLEALHEEKVKAQVILYKNDLGNFFLNEPHDEVLHEYVCEIMDVILKSDSQDKDIWRMKGLINNIMEQRAEDDLRDAD